MPIVIHVEQDGQSLAAFIPDHRMNAVSGRRKRRYDLNLEAAGVL